ncbi:hypothetical protein CVS37_22295 [Burkholderia lata]|nr:hypothetical protein CVS37_22295 [Burkholderia lata]
MPIAACQEIRYRRGVRSFYPDLSRHPMARRHVALANARAMPMPHPVGFAMAPWAIYPSSRRPGRRHLRQRQQPPAVPAARVPEIKA